MALLGVPWDMTLGNGSMGIPSSPFTCWFKPKLCGCNWKVLISRDVQKGTRAASDQQRRAFPSLLNLRTLVLEGLNKCARNPRADFTEGLILHRDHNQCP